MDEFEPTLDDYIKRLRYEQDPDLRANTVWILGRMRDSQIIEPLIEAFNDPNEIVRVRVAEVLGNLKDDRVISPLLEALNDVAPVVRAQAAHSLGMRGDPNTVNPLIDLLQDTEASVRAAAAESLSILSAERAAEILVEKMLYDDDEGVRYFAARGVVAIGGERILRNLTTALQNNSDPVILMQIIETLAQIGNPQAIEAIGALENDADEGVSGTAKWAVGILRKKQ